MKHVFLAIMTLPLFTLTLDLLACPAKYEKLYRGGLQMQTWDDARADDRKRMTQLDFVAQAPEFQNEETKLKFLMLRAVGRIKMKELIGGIYLSCFEQNQEYMDLYYLTSKVFSEYIFPDDYAENSGLLKLRRQDVPLYARASAHAKMLREEYEKEFNAENEKNAYREGRKRAQVEEWRGLRKLLEKVEKAEANMKDLTEEAAKVGTRAKLAAANLNEAKRELNLKDWIQALDMKIRSSDSPDPILVLTKAKLEAIDGMLEKQNNSEVKSTQIVTFLKLQSAALSEISADAKKRSKEIEDSLKTLSKQCDAFESKYFGNDRYKLYFLKEDEDAAEREYRRVSSQVSQAK